jgi:hypothetical protein
VARAKRENKPQPEAKHMTGKMQPELVFEESGEVRVQAKEKSANAPGTPVRKDERQMQGLEITGANGIVAGTSSEGKLESYGYVTTAPSQARADQQAAAAQRAAGQADAVSGSNSLQAEIRNAPSPGLLDWKSALKGSLGGTILDPSGAVVGNAKITMIGPIGTKSATSDPQGRFSFDLLAPGSYSIKAEASGFKATEIKQVAVLEHKSSTLQVRLEPGTTSEVVEVSAAAPSVGEEVAAPAAAPVVNSTTGFVAEQQTAQLSVQKAAVERTRRQEVSGGVGSGAGAPTLRWTLSPEGAVQRSGDSGKTWQAVSVAPGATFRALSAMGVNVWAGGKAGALYHSADSGQTWAKLEPAAGGKKLDQDILHVDFSDPLHGIVNTANGEVWTTSDGGQTWQRK